MSKKITQKETIQKKELNEEGTKWRRDNMEKKTTQREKIEQRGNYIKRKD